MLKFGALILFTFLTSTITVMAGKQELQAVVQANGIFTKQLYNVLAKKEGNVFFSPISIHAALSMTFQGADGETKEAFMKSLNVSDSRITATGYQDIMKVLNNVSKVELSIANKIYIKDGYSFKPEFKEITQKDFLSESESVNFEENVSAAATINGWVEEKTHNKIKDLISPDALNERTRMVLVNAIYFKGNWAVKFDPQLTRKDKFFLNAVDTIDVQMMESKGRYFYKEDENLDAKVLELPYSNPDVSLVIILPNRKDGIVELEQKLADTDLTKITENMYKPEVIVKLPKFKIETTYDLKDPLKDLGLGIIFDQSKADFSGMLDADEELYVSQVIHKAFIEVNEEGTEAAAATGVQMRCRRSIELPVKFTVNKPFLYFLSVATVQNRLSDRNILFYGKMASPIVENNISHDEL